jgi:hypothetical protein
LRGLEDYDLWLRIAVTSNVRYLDEALVVYWDLPGSLSAAPDMERFWQGHLLILDHARKAISAQSRPFLPVAPSYFLARRIYLRSLAEVYRDQREPAAWMLANLRGFLADFFYKSLRVAVFMNKERLS